MRGYHAHGSFCHFACVAAEIQTGLEIPVGRMKHPSSLDIILLLCAIPLS